MMDHAHDYESLCRRLTAALLIAATAGMPFERLVGFPIALASLEYELRMYVDTEPGGYLLVTEYLHDTTAVTAQVRVYCTSVLTR